MAFRWIEQHEIEFRALCDEMRGGMGVTSPDIQTVFAHDKWLSALATKVESTWPKWVAIKEMWTFL
jgi:hypothetical protein